MLPFFSDNSFSTEGEEETDSFTRFIKVKGTNEYIEIEGVFTHHPYESTGEWSIKSQSDLFEYELELFKIVRDDDGNIILRSKLTETKVPHNNPEATDIMIEELNNLDHEVWAGYVVGSIAQEIASEAKAASALMLTYSQFDGGLWLEGGAFVTWVIANKSDRVVDATSGDYKVDINSVDINNVGFDGFLDHYSITNYVSPVPNGYLTYKNFFNGWKHGVYKLRK